MTKRIAAMAACAVMTVTSMVGMGVSAADSENYSRLEKVGNIDLLISNPELEGVYTNQSDSTSFISINPNNTGVCYLENVYCKSDSLYVRGSTDTYAIKNEDENGYFNATLNGNFMVRSGTTGSWNVSSLSYSQINGTLYAVKNWWNVIQYYVIKIGEGTSHEQVFIQG